MKLKHTALAGLAFAMAVGATAMAQQPAPVPPPQVACTLSPAEIAAGRAVALKFFQVTGDDRVALADPTYKQHNPAFKKRAEDNKKTDFEEFRDSFGTAGLAAAAAARAGGPGGGGSASASRSEQSVRGRADRMRYHHRHSQELAAGSDDTWPLLRGVHV